MTDNIGVIMMKRGARRVWATAKQCAVDPGNTCIKLVLGETPAEKEARKLREATEDAGAKRGKKKEPRPADIPASRYLHWAAHVNDLDECRELLESGEYSADAMDGEGLTPLHYACKREGTAAVVALLLERSAEGPNTPTGGFTDHYSPLQLVASYGDVPTAHALVRGGANLNARDKNMYTPIIAAAQFNNALVLHYLALQGGMLSDVDKNGAGALSWAAYEGHLEVVRYLAKSGAFVNAVDAQGRTPLHWAARNSRPTVARELLRRGADASLRDRDGHAPVDLALAQAKKDKLTAEVLRDQAEGASAARRARRRQYRMVKYYVLPVLGVWALYYAFMHLPGYVSVPYFCFYFFLTLAKLGLPETLAADVLEEDGSSINPAGSSLFLGTVAVDVSICYHHWAYATEHHLFAVTHGFVALALMLFFYWRCRTTDAGRLARADVHEQLSAYSDAVARGEPPADLCRTCWIRKPVRSKHCRSCNVCVSEFDHHCMWIRNCVGRQNRADFVLLMVTVAWTLSTYAWVGMHVWLREVDFPTIAPDSYLATRLWLACLVDGSYGFWILFNLIGALFIIMVSGPAIHLIARNTTANEWVNWERYEYLQTTRPDGAPAYHNPFDEGTLTNLKKAFCGRSKGDGSLLGGGGGGVRVASRNTGAHDSKWI